MDSRLFLCIQIGTLCFTGDVPRWNRRNSRCNRSCSVSKSYGTTLQKYRTMCIKPAFPGEFETLFLSLLFLLKGEIGDCPLVERIGTRLSPRPCHFRVCDIILNCAYFYLLVVRSLRERFTSGITSTSWVSSKKTRTPSYRSCFQVYIGYPRTTGTSK